MTSNQVIPGAGTEPCARPEFWVRGYRAARGRHNHGFHQFLIGMEGQLDLYTDTGGLTLTRGTGVIVGRRQTHEFQVSGAASLFVVDFAKGRWAALDNSIAEAEGVRSINLSRPLATLIREAPRATSSTEEAWTPSGRYLDAFIAAIAAILRPCADDRVATAIGRLDAGRGSVPKIDVLAARVGLSPAHLYRLFQDNMGISPARLARSRRLDYGAVLLAGTGAPIAEVAFACGYADQSTFTRAFKRKFGAAPGKWRRRSAMRESAKNG